MKTLRKMKAAAIGLLLSLTVGGVWAYKTMGIPNYQVEDYMHSHGYTTIYAIMEDGDDRIVDTERSYHTRVFVQLEDAPPGEPEVFTIIGHQDM